MLLLVRECVRVRECVPPKDPTASSTGSKSAVQFQLLLSLCFAVLSGAAVYVSARPASSSHVVTTMAQR